MSYVYIDEDEPGRGVGVPKAALLAALALALGTIGVAAVARRTHVAEAPHDAPVAARALVFSDRPDGAIGVYDPRRGETLAPVPVGGGFIRGALRALARQRLQAGIAPDVPFYLARWPDGRLTLDDSATHSHLELRAFGSTNEAAFAVLLPAPAPNTVSAR